MIVFQCPKSFLPTRENIANVRRFFQQIERGARTIAWEPRGGDWTPSLIRKLCAGSGLIHCVDPFDSPPVYGEGLYWRLHGRGGYRYRYTDDDLQELRRKLREFAEFPGPNYVMFNNISSLSDARRFLAMD